MKRQPRLVCSLFLVALLAAAPAGARTWTVDLRAPSRVRSSAAADDGAGGGAELLRAAEAPAAVAPALAPGDVVTLLLFDGETVDLVLEEASASTISGSRAFLARTAGSPLRNAVVLADADGGLHARVQGLDEGRVLRVFPRDGATAVEESEPAPVVEDDPPAAPAPAAAPSADAGVEVPRMAASLQSDQLVDILVAFDRGAKAWAENNGGTTNFAETAVQNMNLSLANSDLSGTFRFRLVGVEFVDDRKTTVQDALNAFGSGPWSFLRTARDACGADVVTMLIDTGVDFGVTGVGYAMTSTQRISYFSALNACAIRAVAKGETMTHEVGHNLGCGHSNAAGASTPGPQSFPYSSGYHFTGHDGKRYHTIMAYNSLNGDMYDLANVFSSPDLTVADVPAGTAEANDNRRVLAETWAWAQSWNEQVVPISYDVFFTPESGAFVDGTLSVSLTPGRDGLPIRYTLDGSAPTLSSPLYTGPITLTASTTIRAATVLDGALGPVCTARYPIPDLAEALDTPGLAWATDSSYPWTFRTDVTFDGLDSVRSGDSLSWYSQDTGLHASIVGPTTMSFRWCACMHNTEPFQHTGDPTDELAVYIDGNKVWSDAAPGLRSPWKQSQVEIPAGSHEVAFRFVRVDSSAMVTGREYNVWIDTVRFDALSAPPVLDPATTDSESTAKTFTVGSQTVRISSPDGDGTLIYYTTDGSDPATDGTLYESPITVTASTRVRAVAVASGRDISVETSGMYLDRHRPVRPGEWTADLTGLLADAATNSSARLILGLVAIDGTVPACESFRLVAEDPAFTSWCAANGVYLLVSDLAVRPDGAAAKAYILDWMETLHPDSAPVNGPVFVALTPDGGTAKADAFAMVKGIEFGSKTYDGSVDSLVACVAALLGGTSLSAPVATPGDELVAGFPVSVTLSNPNGSGTKLRYTLDGSAPTASSPLWPGGTVEIRRGEILTAVVFPSGSGITSPVLRKDYRTVPTHLGIPEDAFAWSTASGDVPWRTFPLASVPTIRSGNLGNSAPAYKSILRATARAAGTLSFTLGDIGYNNDTVFTPPAGDPVTFSAVNYLTAEERTFTIDVRPGDVLDWTRDARNPRTEYEAEEFSVGGGRYQYSYCGSFLSKFSWTPSGDPPALGTVSVAATTTGATVSVPVTALGEGNSSVTVKVVVAGVEQTQTLDAAGTATFDFSGLEPGASYTAVVTATGSSGGVATASKTFSTEALPFAGWFNVKWSTQGWGSGTGWRTAAGEAAAGGTWAVPAGDASSRSGSVLELALPDGGELRFTAVSPSPGGGYVTVDGTLDPVVSPALPNVPSGAFAALCFARGGYKAWNGAQWIALSGATPAASATPWSATFDFSSSPHRVRYTVCGATLSAAGSDWIPLASVQGFVRGVGYAGGGGIGDFKATCGGGFPVPVLAPSGADGAEPLVYDDSTQPPTFTVTIGNAKAGIWYAVYASQTVDGDYAFVKRAHATADGELPLTINATDTTKFVRIKASDKEIDPDDPLFPAAP